MRVCRQLSIDHAPKKKADAQNVHLSTRMYLWVSPATGSLERRVDDTGKFDMQRTLLGDSVTGGVLHLGHSVVRRRGVRGGFAKEVPRRRQPGCPGLCVLVGRRVGSHEAGQKTGGQGNKYSRHGPVRAYLSSPQPTDEVAGNVDSRLAIPAAADDPSAGQCRRDLVVCAASKPAFWAPNPGSVVRNGDSRTRRTARRTPAHASAKGMARQVFGGGE